MFAAIDIHKHAFQAAVLDPEGGEVVEAHFSADRARLGRWADEWQGQVAAVAIEVTTGWRWAGASSRRAASTWGWRSRCSRVRCSGRRRKRQDRPARRVLARSLGGEGDAAVVDPAYGRPSLLTQKLRRLELRAGMPSRRGQRGSTTPTT